MQELLQVFYNINSDNSLKADNSFWWNLCKDFVVPIGIALLAAYIAYLIFVKETKRDRENEERKKAEERLDKLLFFSTIV